MAPVSLTSSWPFQGYDYSTSTWKWYNIYSYTYNGRPIESRIWSIERRHFQWPWTTHPQFQGHAILWRWISQKQYDIIQTQCHWNTNMDLHTPYTQQCHFDWLTLNELEWLIYIFNDTKRRAVSLRQLSFLLIKLWRRWKETMSFVLGLHAAWSHLGL